MQAIHLAQHAARPGMNRAVAVLCQFWYCVAVEATFLVVEDAKFVLVPLLLFLVESFLQYLVP